MRKRMKKKLRSCKMCKPHKMGLANRWKPRELDRMKRDEREILDAVK